MNHALSHKSSAPAGDLNLEFYFIRTGFYDLLPLAIKISREQKYRRDEIIEAICKVFDKYREYPPTRNRTAWFSTVYREKLREARAEILANRHGKR